MEDNRGDKGKLVMELIYELEDKVRQKNDRIKELEHSLVKAISFMSYRGSMVAFFCGIALGMAVQWGISLLLQ